ncbi:MAG: sugar transferase [bacterium]|nr:sugar transferase [bacterium]
MPDKRSDISKRLLDMTGSVAGLAVLAPFLACVALGIVATSPGPVFYRQMRVGRGGLTFRILKFRTMVDGAEARGPRVTGAGDARVTGFGRFLRRHKIDELPQLVNVLRGEMSLVGPRPEVPEFTALYPEEFARVLQVRPGITHRATQLFRREEELLGAAADARVFYVDKILPRKLAIYLADLDRATFWDDLRTIMRTVFDSGKSIEMEILAGEQRVSDTPLAVLPRRAVVGDETGPELPSRGNVPTSMS